MQISLDWWSWVQEPCLKKSCQVIKYLLIHTSSSIDGFKVWKVKTFKKVADQMDLNTVTNIVAIGDSEIEIDAANHIGK